jgi:hypothetical protein
MPTARKRTFLLGIGCQKAGTSWLYDYLSGHDSVFLPTPKELHVFDAMLRPDIFREFHAGAKAEHADRNIWRKLVGRLRGRPPGEHASPGLRVQMIEDPQIYADFFRSQPSEYDVVGEITPSYAALSSEDFKYIRELLEPDFHLKLVLLLRDPVDRAFSAVRHFRRINKGTFPVAVRGDDNALFSRLYDTPYVWSRANYPSIIESIEDAFPAEDIHIGFYETLFTEHAVGELCSFLGLPPRPADFSKIVNASPRPIGLDPDLARRARKAYAPIYDYCAERFGMEQMRTIWPATGDT